MNIDWRDNTAITVIDYSDGRFNIVVGGDSSHRGAIRTIVNQDWWEEHSKNRLAGNRKAVIGAGHMADNTDIVMNNSVKNRRIRKC